MSLLPARDRRAGAPSRRADQRAALLAARYRHVRGLTDRIADALTPEDCVIQSMPDASPTRWHLAHVSWFFETFVLAKLPRYQAFDGRYAYLFNSYYNSVGAQFPRAQRGLLSRPSVSEVRTYRRHVDEAVLEFLQRGVCDEDCLDVVEVGLNHEQQHQELMLTDIKHVFSVNPLAPRFADALPLADRPPTARKWVTWGEGLHEIGHAGAGFAFDNELPRHKVYLAAFSLASHPVTCGEYLEFILDEGYRRPELWLSSGWEFVRQQQRQAPLYWQHADGQWRHFTLGGLLPLAGSLPVCHLSYFEADAFARWAGARLPTEAEWEVAAAALPVTGNFVEPLMAHGAAIHPAAGDRGEAIPAQMYGDVWEWTASAYSAYPGYRPAPGALGEYNGKFMCNQYVLRGGSCATPIDHVRPTYRNFFPPDACWQFSGVRLAKDVPG